MEQKKQSGLGSSFLRFFKSKIIQFSSSKMFCWKIHFTPSPPRLYSFPDFPGLTIKPMQYCIYPLFVRKMILACDQNLRESSSLMTEKKNRRKVDIFAVDDFCFNPKNFASKNNQSHNTLRYELPCRGKPGN